MAALMRTNASRARMCVEKQFPLDGKSLSHCLFTPCRSHTAKEKPVTMWKPFVLPVILVILAWWIASLATTYYVGWLDRSYQRAFVENVASVRAAGVLQEAVWRVQAELVQSVETEYGSTTELAAFHKTVSDELQRLEDAATTPAERPLVRELRSQVADYHRLLGQLAALAETRQREPTIEGRMRALAGEISRTADKLRHLNQQLLSESAMRRQQVASHVSWGRIGIVLVGPAIGLAAGWWMARRVGRSVSRIRVTLHNAVPDIEEELGIIDVTRGDNLEGVHQQVEFFVRRLQKALVDLQQARSEVLRAERLAAIGGLAAGVAHELRNPLTSIKLLLQHAATQADEVRLSGDKLRLILEEIGRIEATIQDLLDFSRPPALKCVRHDLRDTIQRAVNLVDGRAKEHNVALRTDSGDVAAIVDGDPEQLHQVFVNLLINGIEAMADGGVLRINTAVAPDRQLLNVEVADSGTGIPREIFCRLFEPFATSKQRGTGLGLAVSRRIIEEHGGTITARNLKDMGAVFTIALPLAPQDGGEMNRLVSRRNPRDD
jgi:two-component system sensor histidine kinase HydH